MEWMGVYRMIAVNFSTARERFEDMCDKVTDCAETAIVTRKEERNAAFLRKLERGLAQVHAGQGIVKTMEELEAMAL